ncbi:hypothetical protein M405DRAFT_434067 [Rhizopogon salebrosus TDB-379]|nr:hypothetical protein M405DRAFT_434067 [Rhizopogon salebrosus TDB-379]
MEPVSLPKPHLAVTGAYPSLSSSPNSCFILYLPRMIHRIIIELNVERLKMDHAFTALPTSIPFPWTVSPDVAPRRGRQTMCLGVFPLTILYRRFRNYLLCLALILLFAFANNPFPFRKDIPLTKGSAFHHLSMQLLSISASSFPPTTKRPYPTHARIDT